MSAEMSAEQKTEPATLQVGGEDIKVDMEGSGEREIDIHERDPTDMNGHIKVRFQDIIAEPDTEVFSFDKVWTLSYTVFTQTKIWCYRITSLILALPLAVCWGVYFACLSFCTAWVCVPCLKTCGIECHCFRQCYQMIFSAFLDPFFDAIGRCFRQMRVHIVKESI